MAKTLCTGIRKDGQPCQANGLEKYNGLCLAHGAPPEQAHSWRALGGKNSAAAVRRDNRMPEQLKHALDLVQKTMDRLAEQEPTPANCNAISRCAQTLINLRRRADEEMELIRAEETQDAAAAIAGAHPNFDLLKAAARINAEQDRYLSEALVEQGFADFAEPANPDEPPEVVLNHKGRIRFGFHNLDARQKYLKDVDVTLGKHEHGVAEVPDLGVTNDRLEMLEENVEMSLSALAHVEPVPVDPLTGLPFTRVPASVKFRIKDDLLTRCNEIPQQVLAEQRSTIRKLKRRAEAVAESENYQRLLAELQKEPEYLALLEEQFAAQREQIRQYRAAEVPGTLNGEREASSAESSSARAARTRGRGGRR
ncbi:MAG: hypothetical protein F4Y84_07075 [Caldilineaceae bacterium SB0665_bin_25]|nr:hypothetical protein [Caldilineaceae bacterium SB0665_bin_25]